MYATRNAEPDLIQWLEAKRRALRVNHRAFSRLLGTSYATWNAYRYGDRRPTLWTQAIACRAWPADEAAIFAAAKRSGEV